MEFSRFTKKNIVINSVITLVYLLFNYVTTDIRPENYYLVLIWWSAFYLSEKSRRFVLGFSIFILFWVIYDSMRVLPNYEVSTVHIKEPYNIEKLLFGINYQNKLLTPNEYFAVNHSSVLDFLSGFFYINWMPVPLAFGLWLFVKDKDLFLKFSLVFLTVNLLGFMVYYIYPAAPPWYVAKYGFDLHIGVPGSRAGLARFDELIHYPLFEGIYNKNANVLAAMPSLHAAYPVIVLYFGLKKKVGWFNLLFTVFVAGIWFSAVYSGHHYIIDVMAGALLTLPVLFVSEKLFRQPHIKNAINSFVKRI
jgi:hypothetical protein